MTTFLRFPSEGRAKVCMPGWYDDGWCAPDGCAIDVLGPIEGIGFHINVIGDIPPEAMPFVVDPSTPRRVFAE